MLRLSWFSLSLIEFKLSLLFFSIKSSYEEFESFFSFRLFLRIFFSFNFVVFRVFCIWSFFENVFVWMVIVLELFILYWGTEFELLLKVMNILLLSNFVSFLLKSLWEIVELGLFVWFLSFLRFVRRAVLNL